MDLCDLSFATCKALFSVWRDGVAVRQYLARQLKLSRTHSAARVPAPPKWSGCRPGRPTASPDQAPLSALPARSRWPKGAVSACRSPPFVAPSASEPPGCRDKPRVALRCESAPRSARRRPRERTAAERASVARDVQLRGLRGLRCQYLPPSSWTRASSWVKTTTLAR